MTRWKGELEKIDTWRWRIPRSYKPGMRVDGLVYASEAMLADILEEQSLEQVANVACLPGIIGSSLAMPDIHWGYGFPIGGVAATRLKDGVVSPGGVGFDINCGVRLLRTNLEAAEIRPRMAELMDALYRSIPSGLGSAGVIKINTNEIDQVLVNGARWAVENGYGQAADLDVTEEHGEMPGADPDRVSSQAKLRGREQLGTLGSGNHFLEVATIDEIYDTETARAMGINRLGQVVVLIHCGSRGLGHQVAQDYITLMTAAMKKYAIELPDRQLAGAPVNSSEGQRYLGAMRCAANFAWANRQCIMHWVREAFCSVLGKPQEAAGLELVYDVAHNIAKIELHIVDGKEAPLCVHRKGATRAFPAGHPDIPLKYRNIGQPVLIPGDMGRFSYILVGTDRAMIETFGSTCHGAGRLKSRTEAKHNLRGAAVRQDLEARGISVRTGSLKGLAEEASLAYKDVSQVVEVAQQAGISRVVARSRPVGVVKG